ncbi:ATP synthase subunit b, mitochondrial [Plutella xylostella]|uniref:ATP synthase subunit b, mitochondrial n=1 Tax=Plutella xylostella TaxID=51655 RepID=UPI002032DD99|nr:ATP synthase subunit b, mitochondrial [Plutella xylostella]
MLHYNRTTLIWRKLKCYPIIVRCAGSDTNCPGKDPVDHKPVCPPRHAACLKQLEDPNGPSKLVRGTPPSVRLGFLPESWFKFMEPKTGVSGTYVLILVMANYLISKEIFVMEHEYYSGLSLLVMVVFVYKKFSQRFADALDKKVDEVVDDWEKSRQEEVDCYTDIVKTAQEDISMAEAHEMLTEAKKENVILQLEAAFRERSMLAYSTVKGRLDYQAKLHEAESRIHQRWMIEWVLNQVHAAITPQFQKEALESAIANLNVLADNQGKEEKK